MRPTFVLISCLFLVTSCVSQKLNGDEESVIAFPGAEGFGKFTTGGRGGVVMIVSNLKDDGEGSFRQAATAKVPRIIVFQVAGTIHLLTPISIRGNVTIAGQSAPGDGICIADQPVSLGGNNIIIRYLRFRLGDRFQDKGMVDGSGHDDALGGTRKNNIIIDHCSVSWSTDECFSLYAGDSSTIQWNLISEPLNYSYHFEKGDTAYEHHGYGAIWGGRHLSAHHNLFAHCLSRNPRFDGIRNALEENVDFRNNVIYNWGHNNVYAGEGGKYNIVNNYYRPGPSTTKSVRARIVNPNKRIPDIPFGKFFVTGNYVDGAEDVTSNNRLGIHMGNSASEDEKLNSIVNQPFPAIDIKAQSATDAFKSVLEFAGASFQRDTLDERIVNDVKNRTGGFIDVQGGYPHGTPYAKTVKAWPTLKDGPLEMDSDKDGMPDSWENRNKLDPNNPADASEYKLNKYYTNIEVYLNNIVKQK